MAAKKSAPPKTAPAASPAEAAPAAQQAPEATSGQSTPAPAAAMPADAPATAPADAALRQELAARKRWYVVGSVPIRHSGKFYGIGDDIELTASEAERLGGLVAPLPEVPKE